MGIEILNSNLFIKNGIYTIIAMLPLWVYITFFDKKDNGTWLGLFGGVTTYWVRKVFGIK